MTNQLLLSPDQKERERERDREREMINRTKCNFSPLVLQVLHKASRYTEHSRLCMFAAVSTAMTYAELTWSSLGYHT